MPDGWVKLPHLKEGWGNGTFTVMHSNGPGQYFWYEPGVQGQHGGFPDPVSCAVACELATGGEHE